MKSPTSETREARQRLVHNLRVPQSVIDKSDVTIDQWMAMDLGDTRTELINGRVLPRHGDDWEDLGCMASTVGHGRIVRDLMNLLDDQLKERKLPYGSLCAGPAVRVQHNGSESALQPDLFVYNKNLADDDSFFIEPSVVVEVLSRKSAYRDFTIKVDAYLSVDCIHHYLIVDRDRKSITHYNGPAMITRHTQPDDVISLTSPGITFTLEQLFKFESA